jgi:hypothetical protein
VHPGWFLSLEIVSALLLKIGKKSFIFKNLLLEMGSGKKLFFPFEETTERNTFSLAGICDGTMHRHHRL